MTPPENGRSESSYFRFLCQARLIYRIKPKFNMEPLWGPERILSILVARTERI